MTRNGFRIPLSLTGLLLAVLLSWQDATGAENRTDYDVRFLGLPVASLSFMTRIDGRDYTISGRLRTSGLAEIIDKTRGSTSVSGTMLNDRLQASSYVIAYESGKKAQRYEVDFRRGNVTATRQSPPPKKRSKDWVTLSKADLSAVLDPISGMVFPPDVRVCPRTLPIFDGETRVDLKLRHIGSRPFSTAGFSGEAIACEVRFVPRAGYRRGNDSIEYLKKARGMEVWFARNPAADLYAPVYARVPTKIGPVTVRATRFGQ